VAIWVWRNNRRVELEEATRKRAKPPALPLAMVVCQQCGTHLPESEALRGTKGSYCSVEHRQQHERTGG
jgi:uncharacterized protein